MSQPVQLSKPAHTVGSHRTHTIEIDFAKLSPTCNTTVLVTSRHPTWQPRSAAFDVQDFAEELRMICSGIAVAA